MLKIDKDFRGNHLPLLQELADEVRADLERAAQPTPVPDSPKGTGPGTTTPTPMQYATVDVTDISGTFTSQAEADAKWKVRSQSSGVTSRKVVGAYSDETRLSLDYALYRFTTAERPGTELRLLVPIRLGPRRPHSPC